MIGAGDREGKRGELPLTAVQGKKSRPYIEQKKEKASEMDDEAGGHAGGVGAAAGRVQADIVNLRTEGEVRKDAEIHASAEAVGKLAVGAATAADGDAGASEKALHEGSQFGRIMEGKPGTEKIGVGINGNAGG